MCYSIVFYLIALTLEATLSSFPFPLERVFLLDNLQWRSAIQVSICTDSSVGKESASNAGRPRVDSWVGKIRWRMDRLPTPIFLGFPRGSAGKQSACNSGHLGLIPWLGRSPGEGKGYPLQDSGLENSMDGIVHGVSKSWDTTEQLSQSYLKTEIFFKNTVTFS